LNGSDDDSGGGGGGGCILSEYSVLMTNVVAFFFLRVRLDLRLAVVFVSSSIFKKHAIMEL
jgi:hypothetical protein